MDKVHLEGEPRTQRVERVLEVLLRRHPDALVGAISGDSSAGLIPVPDSLGLDPAQPRLHLGAMVSQVKAADRVQVARLWTEARSVGLASAVVGIEGSEEPTTMYMLDFRDQHGVLVLVSASGADPFDDQMVRAGADVRPAARVARIVKDPTATIIAADDAFERMLGWPTDEILGSRSLTLIHPDDHDTAAEHWIHMLAMAGASSPVRLRHRHKDGRWLWIEVLNHNRLEEYGDIVAEMVDVSEEVAALDAVRARQQLLEQVTEALPIGLLHADSSGRLLYANQRLSQITGLLVGDNLTDWGRRLLTSGDDVGSLLARAAAGEPAETVLEVIDGTGESRYYSLRIRPFLDSGGSITGITGAVEDVTAGVIERRQLELRAATDSLTGCFNRSATLALAQDALDTLQSDDDSEGNGGVTVIFVDVDDLKAVNDQFGHAAGDALLNEVATRLRSAVRARDVVGRFGGDEFVVVLTNIKNADQALMVASWMAARVAKQPFVFDGSPMTLRASVGVAWSDTAGAEATTLIRQADAAMYISKRDGLGEPVMAGRHP